MKRRLFLKCRLPQRYVLIRPDLCARLSLSLQERIERERLLEEEKERLEAEEAARVADMEEPAPPKRSSRIALREAELMERQRLQWELEGGERQLRGGRVTRRGPSRPVYDDSREGRQARRDDERKERDLHRAMRESRRLAGEESDDSREPWEVSDSAEPFDDTMDEYSQEGDQDVVMATEDEQQARSEVELADTSMNDEQPTFVIDEQSDQQPNDAHIEPSLASPQPDHSSDLPAEQDDAAEEPLLAQADLPVTTTDFESIEQSQAAVAEEEASPVEAISASEALSMEASFQAEEPRASEALQAPEDSLTAPESVKDAAPLQAESLIETSAPSEPLQAESSLPTTAKESQTTPLLESAPVMSPASSPSGRTRMPSNLPAAACAPGVGSPLKTRPKPVPKATMSLPPPVDASASLPVTTQPVASTSTLPTAPSGPQSPPRQPANGMLPTLPTLPSPQRFSIATPWQGYQYNPSPMQPSNIAQYAQYGGYGSQSMYWRSMPQQAPLPYQANGVQMPYSLPMPHASAMSHAPQARPAYTQVPQMPYAMPMHNAPQAPMPQPSPPREKQ